MIFERNLNRPELKLGNHHRLPCEYYSMPAAMNDEVVVLPVSGYRFLPTDLKLELRNHHRLPCEYYSMPATMNDEVVVLPVSGYKFLPTDLELIRDYLCKKITNQKLPSDVPVVEYDIYSTEPWNLPVNNKIDTINSNRSYYFVKLMDGIDRRQRIVKPSNSDDDHNNGIVALGGTRRGGDGGYWKKIAGGRDTRCIRDQANRCIGVKKSFAFHAYLNSPAPRHTNNNNNNNNNISTSEEDDGNTTTTTTTAMTTWKTNWIMDEYSLNSQRTQPWVLCILRKRGGGGEEEDDEVELLSKLKQVQQQPQQQQQPAIINHDHDHLERQELRMLGEIKTIKERIKTNQIQIWDDQQKLRILNGNRISLRRLKFCKIINARDERFEQIRGEFSEGKITLRESLELEYPLWEEYRKKKAKIDAEEAVIRAGSYYQVQLPSRFKKRRKN